jgi:TetR/AcrR family transcriptional repressor of nem operon
MLPFRWLVSNEKIDDRSTILLTDVIEDIVDRSYTRRMGRTSDARDRLLAAACELMLRRGYGAIGVAEICAQADVRKGSFYYFFPSKQALTLAAINAHWTLQRAEWTDILGAPEPALTRLETLIQQQVSTQRQVRDANGEVPGCLFGNLALELSNQEQEVRQRIEEIFDEQIDLVQETLRDAAKEGTIPRSAADRATARAVVAQLEGMVLLAKLGNDPSVLTDLWEQTLRMTQAVARTRTLRGRVGVE